LYPKRYFRVCDGIITIPNGIDFKSLDGKKTKLFVYIISPESKRNEHIRMLSAISRALHKRSNVNILVSLKDSEQIKKHFLEMTAYGETPKRKKHDNFIIKINVQVEEKFEEVLTVITELEDCFAYVMDVNDPSYYLHKLPLFASFWGERKQGFNKLIVATISKPYTNEAIRRINSVISELGDQPGIMMTVEKLFYYNGSLNI